MKEIKNLNKWGDIISHSWIGKTHIKTSVLPNLVYRPSQSQSKSQQDSFIICKTLYESLYRETK